MNLGQAVAVCLYELASRAFPAANAAGEENALKSTGFSALKGTGFSPYIGATEKIGASAPEAGSSIQPVSAQPTAPSASLGLLADVIEESMRAAGYSPASMQVANRHDLRLLLRRLSPTERDTRRILGLFRRILWKLKRAQK